MPVVKRMRVPGSGMAEGVAASGVMVTEYMRASGPLGLPTCSKKVPRRKVGSLDVPE